MVEAGSLLRAVRPAQAPRTRSTSPSAPTTTPVRRGHGPRRRRRPNREPRIDAYVVESENFETIHNHSAYALIEHDKRVK